MTKINATHCSCVCGCGRELLLAYSRNLGYCVDCYLIGRCLRPSRDGGLGAQTAEELRLRQEASEYFTGVRHG